MLLSAGEVRALLEGQLAYAKNLGLKVGAVEPISTSVCRATVLNASGEVVVDIEIDRVTGHIRQII